jgi:cytochrome c-type biogenesis protein CcmF
MAHFGVGMTVLGIVATTAYESENIVIMKPGNTAHISGYTLRLDKISPQKGPNFSETVARISVIRDDKVIDVLEPTKRLYTARKMPTSESAIKTFVFTQLYLALGEVRDDGSVVVRIWWKPLITLIWLGTVVMFFGGMLSLSDRRLRVGAPKPAVNRIRTAHADT